MISCKSLVLVISRPSLSDLCGSMLVQYIQAAAYTLSTPMPGIRAPIRRPGQAAHGGTMLHHLFKKRVRVVQGVLSCSGVRLRFARAVPFGPRRSGE